MENIDHVYVINLEKDVERRQAILKQCSTLLINPTIVSAILGKDLTTEEIKANCTFGCQLFCTHSMIGCAMSHIICWKNVIANGDRYALILEDDAVFVDGFLEKFKEIWAKVPDDVDMLYLGCTVGCSIKQKKYNMLNVFNKNRNEFRFVNDSVYVPELPLSSHAYVITNKGARLLLKEIEGKIETHLDFQIGAHITNVVKYAVEPQLIVQHKDSGKSTMASAYPRLLTKPLDYVLNEDNEPYGYILTVPFFEVLSYPVSLYSLILIVVGAVFDLRVVTGLFLIENFIELMIKPSWDTVKMMIGAYCCILLGFWVRRLVYP